MAYAGLDVGTSGCKIVVYDRVGSILYQTSETYREYGKDGYREIDPDEVMEKIFSVLRRMGALCAEPIDVLAVSSLGESVVCLDKDDNSLCRSMVTGDKRGIDECRELTEVYTPEKIMEITGLVPSEMYGLPKYIWLSRNTDAINNADKILFYEDFAGYVLTGARCVSYSSAARSMAFDINEKEWSKELLGTADIHEEQMSKPVKAGTIIGTIKPDMAKNLGLNPQMKVAAGGHDQSCAALGSGLNAPHIAECGMGTCEFMFFMLPQFNDKQYMIENDFTRTPYELGERYLTSLEVTTCGILKNWCKDTFLHEVAHECRKTESDFFSCLDSRMKGMETELLVLPQFGSSGNPDINYNVRGTITGLTVHTRPEEIYLAVLEGIAFQMKLAYERLEKMGVSVEKLICTGGGAKSDVTLQMRADIFGIEVDTVQSKETGTLGCMILAAVADGAYQSIEEAVKQIVRTDKRFFPNVSRKTYYERKFAKYKKLYECMHLF